MVWAEGCACLLSIIIWVDLATAYKIGCRANIRGICSLLVSMQHFIYEHLESCRDLEKKGTLIALEWKPSRYF